MLKIVNTIIYTLNKNKIEIFSKNFDSDKWFIIGKNVLICVSSSKRITIDFHVSCSPLLSAEIVNLLRDLDIKIIIGNIFMYDGSGNIFEGEEAKEMSEKKNKDDIINDFIKEQMQKHYLMNNQVGSC